jgi:hypothetical protein
LPAMTSVSRKASLRPYRGRTRLLSTAVPARASPGERTPAAPARPGAPLVADVRRAPARLPHRSASRQRTHHGPRRAPRIVSCRALRCRRKSDRRRGAREPRAGSAGGDLPCRRDREDGVLLGCTFPLCCGLPCWNFAGGSARSPRLRLGSAASAARQATQEGSSSTTLFRSCTQPRSRVVSKSPWESSSA